MRIDPRRVVVSVVVSTAIAASLGGCASTHERGDACSRLVDRLAEVHRYPEYGLLFVRVVDDGLDCAIHEPARFRSVALAVIDDRRTFAVWTAPEHDQRACAGELMLDIVSVLERDDAHGGYYPADGVMSDAERSSLIAALDRLQDRDAR